MKEVEVKFKVPMTNEEAVEYVEQHPDVLYTWHSVKRWKNYEGDEMRDYLRGEIAIELGQEQYVDEVHQNKELMLHLANLMVCDLFLLKGETKKSYLNLPNLMVEDK